MIRWLKRIFGHSFRPSVKWQILYCDGRYDNNHWAYLKNTWQPDEIARDWVWREFRSAHIGCSIQWGPEIIDEPPKTTLMFNQWRPEPYWEYVKTHNPREAW